MSCLYYFIFDYENCSRIERSQFLLDVQSEPKSAAVVRIRLKVAATNASWIVKTCIVATADL